MKRWGRFGLVWLLGFRLAACGGGEKEEGKTCDPSQSDCDEGMVCEAVADRFECFAPLVIRGEVRDFKYAGPVTGALVLAADANGAAVGDTGESEANGSFAFIVPAVRDEEGRPTEGTYTLRVQAAGFEPFPTALRPALPVYAENATGGADGWVLEGSQTKVKLIPVPGDASQLASISGMVLAESPAGVLVIAENQGASFPGFSASDGDYTVFNLTAGNYAVKGYRAGLQLDSAEVSVAAGEDKTGVDLSELDKPLNSVTGAVQIVDAPGGSQTSVVLAVESTFVENAARGLVPPGLRAGEVTGGFLIEGVPDGSYVVLAAFENDGLVRDPDQTIGGTSLVRIEVPDYADGNTVTLPTGFKVTGALAVLGPGAEGPEAVTSPAPLFRWADDSSEDGYELFVYDAYGSEVWSQELGPVSGGVSVEAAYGGPPLEAGIFYQFKAFSFRDKQKGRTRISSTEDLKGVFYYLP